MCSTCGCGEDDTRVTVVGELPAHAEAAGHHHAHSHGSEAHSHGGGEHGHDHLHGAVVVQPRTETVALELNVLAKNDELAAVNRDWLAAQGTVALNLMSSPGAGKTTLLERTLRAVGGGRPVAVVEGDQETTLDADRIRATGARVAQVNTGAGCHLDASMLHDALHALRPDPGSLLFVENVGNLVCPALFDLGEWAKVVIISVTEGADKPLKYPHIFAVADLVVINKVDLLPYVDFDVEVCARHARAVNPGVRIIALSATTGEGVDEWFSWLERCGAGTADRGDMPAGLGSGSTKS